MSKTHSDRFSFLIGKEIKQVRYMTEDEASQFVWDKRPLILEFADGSQLILMQDDEGNDGGSALYIQDDNEQIIYTL